MERTEWSVMEDNQIALDVINALENTLTDDEIKEMERKMNEIIGLLNFRDYTDKLVAIDAFKKGYVAAHISYLKK